MNIHDLVISADAQHFAEVVAFLLLEFAGYRAFRRLLNRPVPYPVTRRNSLPV